MKFYKTKWTFKIIAEFLKTIDWDDLLSNDFKAIYKPMQKVDF